MAKCPTPFPEWVDRRGDDECWEWKGAIAKTGYGLGDFLGKKRSAHRIAFIRHWGRIPDGVVMHICDNRKCVNPSHLVEGSHQDNADDMTGKGRQCRGSASPRARVSEDDVRSIRSQRASGALLREIAIQYSISEHAVHCIVKGKTWKHVSDE